MYQCSKKLVKYKNTLVLTIMTFQHIQCLHLMYASEVAWVLVSLGTQVQPQIILNPDYLCDFFPFLMTMIGTKDYNHIYRNNIESQSTIMIAF